MPHANFSDLLGKTLVAIDVAADRESISFLTEDGEQYLMFHVQDCCEVVNLEDVSGDIQDLVGSPILKAEVSTSEKDHSWGDHTTWTYYLISTMKGDVSLRWYGSSNGYYSESVDFRLFEAGDDLHQLEF